MNIIARNKNKCSVCLFEFHNHNVGSSMYYNPFAEMLIWEPFLQWMSTFSFCINLWVVGIHENKSTTWNGPTWNGHLVDVGSNKWR